MWPLLSIRTCCCAHGTWESRKSGSGLPSEGWEHIGYLDTKQTLEVDNRKDGLRHSSSQGVVVKEGHPSGVVVDVGLLEKAGRWQLEGNA